MWFNKTFTSTELASLVVKMAVTSRQSAGLKEVDSLQQQQSISHRRALLNGDSDVIWTRKCTTLNLSVIVELILVQSLRSHYLHAASKFWNGRRYLPIRVEGFHQGFWNGYAGRQQQESKVRWCSIPVQPTLACKNLEGKVVSWSRSPLLLVERSIEWKYIFYTVAYAGQNKKSVAELFCMITPHMTTIEFDFSSLLT